MINTKEKIYTNAFFQTLQKLGEEKNVRIIVTAGPSTPEEFTQAFYDGPNLKWLPAATGQEASDMINGDEPKGTAPSGVTYDSIKALVDTRFSELCYSRFRQVEYPPVEDYLDAIVKSR